MQPIYIDEYNYPLPDERIARYPLSERDHSKLLVYKNGQVSEDLFYNIGDYIPAHSLLVYNNTRVIQARLVFHKESGARIEVFCLEPIAPHDYQLSLGSQTGCTWKTMIGNLKKWKEGSLTLHVGATTLYAKRLATVGNTHQVQFTWDNPTISFAEILDAMGELPIPPYLNRKTEESDKTTYQTVYSSIKGSVAAPTAGLHFTDGVLNDLRSRGIRTTEVTLHVGAGTFQPVKTDDANLHTMHTEIIAVPRQAIEDIRNNVGHIVAVGTTSMRTLESLYFIGEHLQPATCHLPPATCHLQPATCPLPPATCNLQPATCHLLSPPSKGDLEGLFHVSQFEPYEREHTLTTADAMQAILDYLDRTHQTTLHAETQIMIEPGYEFHVVDQLITNFHQPKSTLLLLVSAFVQGDWHTIYHYALSHDFRFLSYGDSSILFRC